MKETSIRFEHQPVPPGCRTAVSLHSHTFHSRESLDFIDRLAADSRLVEAIVRRAKRRYHERHGRILDFRRAWWTPPLSPHAAWELEKRQMEDSLGLRSMVSLTDQENIDAPLSLHVLQECRDVPISVEWTVPYEGTFFHLGLHNIPADTSRAYMAMLGGFTAHPDPAALSSILTHLSETPGVLVVFNHPCWDESRVGHDRHRSLAVRFLQEQKPNVHALELNGLRPVLENRLALRMAREFDKPVVSGGDRHGLEPNTVLNLTNAGSFSEFVEEVRSGFSQVLVMRHFFEPFAIRVLRTIEDVLGTHDGHQLGWRMWSDRVFYECEDGSTRSLTELMNQAGTGRVIAIAKMVDWVRRNNIRDAFRYLTRRPEQVLF